MTVWQHRADVVVIGTGVAGLVAHWPHTAAAEKWWF